MYRSDADELNIEMPPIREVNSRVNRNITLPACYTSGLASVISIFCIGLVPGAAGGLLLGATAVVLLQSLELLADNTPLMDQFGEKINHTDHYNDSNNEIYDFQVSIFTVMFGVFSSVLSLAVGTYVGLAAYSLVIRSKGAAASGKALAVAGPVCLMGVTATGCLLGLAFEGFLSMTLNVISHWFLIQVEVLSLFTIIAGVFSSGVGLTDLRDFLCFFSIFGHVVVFNTYLICLMVGSRLILVLVLIPMIIVAQECIESCDLKTTTAAVIMMLSISDMYDIAGQSIVALQSPTSTTTSSVVVEAIFIGVLASLMLTVSVGMSLFVALQRGGASKICATAAATGSAVLGAIKLALPVLGLGPIIGALIGVAGAAGVSLAAAGAVTDQYRPEGDWHRLSGRLGVTVGAAVGAFFMSCAHSGLSVMFMALCAATVPAGAFLKLLYFHVASQRLEDCLCNFFIPAVFNLFLWISVMSGCFLGTWFWMGLLFRMLPSFLCCIWLSGLSS